MNVTCPKCGEDRMTEIITTKQTRRAFCAVCSHSWLYEQPLCTCARAEAPHMHDAFFPLCPQCGASARLTEPT